MWKGLDMNLAFGRRKSYSEGKIAEGSEAPRNSLDVCNKPAEFFRTIKNDDIPFGVEIPMLEMDLEETKSGQKKSPSVIAKLMGLDPMPVQSQKMGGPRKPLKDLKNKQFIDIDSTKSGPLRPLSRLGSTRNLKTEQENMEPRKSEVMKSVHRLSQRGSVVRQVADPKTAKDFLGAMELLQSNKEFFLRFLQNPDSVSMRQLAEMQMQQARSRQSRRSKQPAQQGSKQKEEAGPPKKAREVRAPSSSSSSSTNKKRMPSKEPQPAKASKRDISPHARNRGRNQCQSSPLASHKQPIREQSPSKIVLAKPSPSVASSNTFTPRAPALSREHKDPSKIVLVKPSPSISSSSSFTPRLSREFMESNSKHRQNSNSEHLTNPTRDRGSGKNSGTTNASNDPKAIPKQLVRETAPAELRNSFPVKLKCEEPANAISTSAIRPVQSREAEVMSRKLVSGRSMSNPNSPPSRKEPLTIDSAEGRARLMEKLLMVQNQQRKDFSVSSQINGNHNIPENHILFQSADAIDGSKSDRFQRINVNVEAEEAVCGQVETTNHVSVVLTRSRSLPGSSTAALRCSQNVQIHPQQSHEISDLFWSIKHSNIMKQVVPKHERVTTSKSSEEQASENPSQLCRSSSIKDTLQYSTISQAVDKEPPSQPSRPMPLMANNSSGDSVIAKAELRSPVSVLDIPFQDGSPSPVDIKSRATDLEEVRAHLMELDNSQPVYTKALDLKTTDAAELAESPGPNDTIIAFHGLLQQVPDGKSDKEVQAWGNHKDMQYVKKVLTEADRSQWYSPNCPLNPSIFETVEQHYKHGCSNQGGRTRAADSLNRHLMFDVLNEVLFWKLQPWSDSKTPSNNWKSLLSSPPKGEKLMQDMYLELSGFHSSHCEPVNLVETLVDKDLSKSQHWTSQEEVERIGVKLVQLLFNDLVEDVILDLMTIR